MQATTKAVWTACCQIIGTEEDAAEVDELANLVEMGIDSLGLAELVIQLEELYGEGAISIDDVLSSANVSQIAAKLVGGTVVAAPSSKAAATVVPSKPMSFLPATPSPKPLTHANLDSTPLSAEETNTSPYLERIDRLESCVMQLTQAIKTLTPLAQKGLLATDDCIVPETPSLTDLLATESDDKCSHDLVGSGALLTDVLSADQGTAVAPGPDSDWILTTHVGSLPRATIAEDGTVTVPELDARTIINQQKVVGLSIINDGEWSRENYIADLLSRLEGVGSDDPKVAGPACLCEMPVAEDMRAVPTYAKRFTGGNGLITLNPKRIASADQACTAYPSYRGTAGLFANLNPFLEGLESAGVPINRAFWGCPSPGTLATFCEDRFFCVRSDRDFCGDHAAYVTALAEAVRPEYEAIAATGVQLQIDCPDLAMGRHTRFTHLSDEEFAVVADLNVKALNEALVNVPREQVCIFACCGLTPCDPL